MTRRTYGLCVLGGLCGLAVIIAANLTEGRAAAARCRFAAVEIGVAVYRPRSGCAAAACHNGGGYYGNPGNEFGLVARSPRQGIFRSLERAIAGHHAKLEATDAGQSRCSMLSVSCHARAGRRSGAADGRRRLQKLPRPGRDWRAIHYQPNWKTLSVAEKADTAWPTPRTSSPGQEMRRVPRRHAGQRSEPRHDRGRASAPGIRTLRLPRRVLSRNIGAANRNRTARIGSSRVARRPMVSARAAAELLRPAR